MNRYSAYPRRVPGGFGKANPDQSDMAVDTLKQLVRYEPETGKLFWLERPRKFCSSDREANSWNARFAGREAFKKHEGDEYPTSSILGRKYKAHRVCWALHYGRWPVGHIDHVNGDRKDNRIANLRDVDRSGNQKNMKLHKSNTSGVCGVTWSEQRRKWVAQIVSDGRAMSLGRFSTKDEAVAARKAAEVRFGFHENHGRTA